MVTAKPCFWVQQSHLLTRQSFELPQHYRRYFSVPCAFRVLPNYSTCIRPLSPAMLSLRVGGGETLHSSLLCLQRSSVTLSVPKARSNELDVKRYRSGFRETTPCTFLKVLKLFVNTSAVCTLGECSGIIGRNAGKFPEAPDLPAHLRALER